MKRYGIIVLALLSILATLNVMVDPSDLWHPYAGPRLDAIGPKAVVAGLSQAELAGQKLGMATRGATLDWVVVGSSLGVQFSSSLWPAGSSVANLAVTGATFGEQLGLLQTLLESGPPRNILWIVDPWAFDSVPLLKPPFFRPYIRAVLGSSLGPYEKLVLLQPCAGYLASEFNRRISALIGKEMTVDSLRRLGERLSGKPRIPRVRLVPIAQYQGPPDEAFQADGAELPEYYPHRNDALQTISIRRFLEYSWDSYDRNPLRAELALDLIRRLHQGACRIHLVLAPLNPGYLDALARGAPDPFANIESDLRLLARDPGVASALIELRNPSRCCVRAEFQDERHFDPRCAGDLVKRVLNLDDGSSLSAPAAGAP